MTKDPHGVDATIEMVRRAMDEGHVRGCKGREYSCTEGYDGGKCGYDALVDNALVGAYYALKDLRWQVDRYRATANNWAGRQIMDQAQPNRPSTTEVLKK